MAIQILDKDTANKIAAGEIIVDPAAVIKELVENSIDANSTRIDISIIDGGKKNITVTDNGDGIHSNEVALAFDRHGTSKISKLDDLNELTSLGFRGEALPSIAAISKIFIKTQSRGEESGSFAIIRDSKIEIKKRSYSVGTSISVEDIFYNTPARLKHMKKGNELAKNIIQLIEKIALSHPDITFSLSVDGKKVIKTPGDHNLLNCIYSIFGKEFGDNLILIDYENSPLYIKGYLGKPTYTRNNRKHQYMYVNSRLVQDSKIAKAVEEAFENTIMVNQHPVFILNIIIPPSMLDVNVHPSKTEIKILNESLVLLLIKDGIRKTIRRSSTVKRLTPKASTFLPEGKEYIQGEIESPKKSLGVPQEHIMPSFQPQKQDTLEEREVENDFALNNYLTESNKLFKNTKLIGQLFSTYLLFEGEDFILLVDQHAAHERVMYEDISKKMKEGEIVIQQILPVNIHLSPSELQVLLNHRDLFNKIGFEFDDFGNSDICIRGVPIFLNTPQEANLLLKIIEEIEMKVDRNDITKFEDSMIRSACKRAIKANQRLNSKEVEALIEQLSLCDYPYTCPHGRPTIVRMTKYEFEKQFKRVQ